MTPPASETKDKDTVRGSDAYYRPVIFSLSREPVKHTSELHYSGSTAQSWRQWAANNE